MLSKEMVHKILLLEEIFSNKLVGLEPTKAIITLQSRLNIGVWGVFESSLMKLPVINLLVENLK